MQISSSILSTNAATQLHPASDLQSAPTATGGLRHAAGEFESMLLTQWLEAAENTFGSTPGADEEQDGADLQVKSFAVQTLAKGITAAGGIGLSALVSQALSKEPNSKGRSSDSAAAVHGTKAPFNTDPGAQQ